MKMSNDDKNIRHSHIQMKLRLPQPTTVYLVKLDDYDLPWLHTDGWAISSLTGVSYHGIHATRHTDWGVGNVHGFELEESHYGTASSPMRVWQKTFPAGTVEMRGNNGGDGSYLIILANPGHQPSSSLTLWSQHQHDAGRMKCNDNVDMQYVADQAACQQLAVQNGHPFYSFRHNGESSGHKCMSSALCNSPLTDRTNDWAVYTPTSPVLYTTVAVNTKCPNNHEDRLFRVPTDGSSEVTLAECYAQCAATVGCNHFSHGDHGGGHVCMGCTTLANAEAHAGFTAYDMHVGQAGTTSDGCLTSNHEDGENPTTVHTNPHHLAAVRCCSEDGTTCQTQDLPGSVMGPVYGVDGDYKTDQTCINSVTFDHAEAICAEAGRRLCTVAELDAGRCCGSGCWHDHRAIWTSN